MKTHELVIEMKLLERGLTLYEEKYGVLIALKIRGKALTDDHSPALRTSPPSITLYHFLLTS